MGDLKGQAVRAVKWTSFSTVIVALLQFLQLIILSKFLSAEEFGLVAIVSVVVGFAQIFIDMGISNAIIHKQQTTHNQLSTLYWLNIISGIFLTVVMFFLSELIAFFYGNDKLIPLLQLVSLSFCINSIGNQFLVLLKKALYFNFIAKIEVLSIVLAFLSAIVFAYLGFGAYSIIYSTLLKSILSNLILLFIGFKNHKPHLVFVLSDVKDYLNFGIYQTGQNMIGYFNNQFDVILIGKLLGTEVLGVYSVTKQLVMRPSKVMIPIITKVAFPIMAKIQNDTDRLKNIYLKMINYIISINFPIHIVMVLFAKEIVFLLLGEKWIESIEIFQILALYALIRSTMSPAGSLVLATGRVKIGLFWNIAAFLYIPVAIYIGHYYGIKGVVYALLSYQIIFSFANWLFIVKKLCGATFREYFGSQTVILLITLIPMLVILIFPLDIVSSDMVHMLMKLVVYSIFYLSLTYFFNKTFFTGLGEFFKKT